MAWLKQGQEWKGLPPFQPQPPPGAPAAALRAGSLGSQASLGSAGLQAAYSIDTQRSTEEEEELSRELTMELMADLQIQHSLDGSRSRRSSAYPSRGASLVLGDDAQPGGLEPSTSSVPEDEEADYQEEELQPSLYDQLGGGVAVKVRRAGCGCAWCGRPVLAPLLWPAPAGGWPLRRGEHACSCGAGLPLLSAHPFQPSSLPCSPPPPTNNITNKNRRWWTTSTAACCTTRGWRASLRAWT